MSETVKKVAVYNGQSWDKHDIGAEAKNVTLNPAILGNAENVQSAFSNLFGDSNERLGDGKVVITNEDGRITTTGSVNVSALEGLSDMVVTDNAGAPTENVEFVSGDTTLTPTSTSEVSLLTSSDSWSSKLNKISLMFRNIRYLINKLGTTDLTGIGDGTVTGAINTLNTKFIISYDHIDYGSGNFCDFTMFNFGLVEITFYSTTLAASSYSRNLIPEKYRPKIAYFGMGVDNSNIPREFALRPNGIIESAASQNSHIGLFFTAHYFIDLNV